jgi:hypothetical protein
MATCRSRVNDVMSLLARAVNSNAVAVADSGVEPLPDGTGYRLELSRKADLRVSFGRIEECRYDEAGSVIVPPANEFFDDACITDHKSALGAFVKHHFDGQVDDFTKLVAQGPSDAASAEVRRARRRALSRELRRRHFLVARQAAGLEVSPHPPSLGTSAVL